MKLLILGGTEFVGRAVAEDAVRRGWEVTVFHRGRFPAPEGTASLIGDRLADGGLAPLTDSEAGWDAVVDTWSGAPVAVRDAARLLADRGVRHYAYVSSRSVYPEETTAAGADESAAVVDASPDSTEGDDYARAKRGGELAAEAAFGDRALFVRAGLILGPYENVGRLPWWLTRMRRGGEVLAPGPYDLPLQYIDARDLAAWTLDAVEGGLGGAYDVVSAPGHATMGEFLEACVKAASSEGSDAVLRWYEPEAVLAAGFEPWTELPVWLPPGPLHDYLHSGDTSKARAAGLRCRPVAETVADTWAWLRSIGGEAPQRSDRGRKGVDPEREAAFLSAS
ncbi:NAD-dependent epimerase/dehydratase family protein [Streptomyces sp. A7024]|uniref:NAD-dependent epimerase/dehydratase family protein n=1 Tax=Streptomyces coryli TaxID=1128680 RepID=A0A6G4UAB4_9ACTN|nr:NAD-dependent epimerase/dehydratase family protein [Streptomyces coryli]NGN69073.1 NAD-dependent epimerase/dehydratase family protein [Streptomyces coryli]